MLAFFRNLSKSWVANVFFVVLIISFAAWGVKDVFHPRISTAVITAGAHEVQPTEFKRIFDNYGKQAMQQTGEALTAAQAVAQGIDVRIAQAVMADQAMGEFVRRLGLAPSDAQIADQIKKQPVFFDQVSGKFDEQAYERMLSQIGMTPEQFQTTLGDEIAQDQFASGLGAGLKQPLAYGALMASYELEGRTLSYFLLTPDNVPPPPPPTDQQLQAFISQHAEQLRRPETRVLTVARFSAKTLAPALTPDPAKVQQTYDFRKDSLSSPEKRSLVEIPARDAATAQAIAARLNAGERPDAVAKAIGAQPVTYADAAKSAVADPKVADAAFLLAAGQVSGPVQTSLAGLAVIKVTAVTPAKTPSLDEARPQIEAQVRNDLAMQKVYDQEQKYDDAHASGANLTEAAQKAGVTPIQLGPVSAQGVDTKGQPVGGLSPKLLKEAFDLAQGGETEVEQDGAGEYFAVHVDKVVAPAVPTLDEIKAPLTRYWMTQQMVVRLNARADELAGKVRKGETLDAAAAEAGSHVGHAVAVTRASMRQNRTVGEELAGKLFAARAGDIITGQTAQIPVMVGRIDAIQPPPPEAAATPVVAQRAQGSGQLFSDLGQLVRIAATRAVKPTYDLDRVRSAIGASAEDAAKAPAAGGQPARAQ
jgi:peptidyl-prolyl cis-trans isomerase D